MLDTKHKPTANSPHSVHVLNEEYQKTYLINSLDKFLMNMFLLKMKKLMGGEQIS